ncbi:MAG: hypothetical protein ACKOUT_12575 [Novosphingobium sp.]
MNTRFIDWIWNVRGSLPLGQGQSGEEALAKLSPLFLEPYTEHNRSGDTLTFTKTHPAAQDKMAVFDSGVITVEQGVGSGMLNYRLTSRFLLFSFLAPLLFVFFGQLVIWTAKPEPTPAEAATKAKEAAAKPLPQLHPIDKFLGAPAPEKAKPGEQGRRKPSATSAYVLAGLFAALYVIGRILEAWLVKRLFLRRLEDESA